MGEEKGRGKEGMGGWRVCVVKEEAVSAEGEGGYIGEDVEKSRWIHSACEG